MIRIFGLFLLIAMPAFAQDPFGTDFDRVFSEHSDEVVRTEQGNEQWEEKLLLQGPVLLTRGGDKSGNKFAYGLDQSEQGAVGCLLVIAIDVRAAAEKCPAALPPEQVSALDQVLGAIGQFYAAHNIPKRSVSEMRDSIEQAIQARVDDMQGSSCSADAMEFVQGFASTVATADYVENIEARLGPARLPVTNPCL